VPSSTFSPPNALEYDGYDDATLSVANQSWNHVADCGAAFIVAKVSVESTPRRYFRFLHLDRFSLAFDDFDSTTVYLSEQDSGGSPKKSYKVGKPTENIEYYFIGYETVSKRVFGGYLDKDGTDHRATSEPLGLGEGIYVPCSSSTRFGVGVKGAGSSVRVRYDDVAVMFSR